jgi:hypothetical protein
LAIFDVLKAGNATAIALGPLVRVEGRAENSATKVPIDPFEMRFVDHKVKSSRCAALSANGYGWMQLFHHIPHMRVVEKKITGIAHATKPSQVHGATHLIHWRDDPKGDVCQPRPDWLVLARPAAEINPIEATRHE